MSRYELTRKRKSDRKFVSNSSKIETNHYSTTIYDTVSKVNSDIYVIAQYGDRLDHLAYEFYGDQHLWWFIARVNNINAMNVPAGTRLRIPVSVNNAKGS